jgi:ABC-type transport system involved in Fe-S cluster assembly fused permease/ATPase subunit
MRRRDSISSTAREMWSLFNSVATPYVKVRLALSVAAAGVATALGALGPLALKWLVDSFSGSRPEMTLGTLGVLVAFVGSLWAGRVLGSLQLLIQTQADRRLYRMLNDRMFHHVMRLPLRYHLNRQTGGVNETLSNGLLGYQIVLQVALHSSLPIVIQFSTVAFVLLQLQQAAFLFLLLIAMICYGAAFVWTTVVSSRAAREVSVAQIDAQAVMTDGLLNYETVKYFTAENFLRQRIDQALKRSEKDWLGFAKTQAWSGLLIASIFAAFMLASTYYAATQVMAGTITIGTFVMINAYMMQLVAPVEATGIAVQQLSQGLAFLEKMLELSRETPESPDTTMRKTSHDRGHVEFQRVSVAYRSDRPALTEVSFEIPVGKTIGIVGPSGAGKSTLVRLLVRLIDPDSGRILLDGVPANELSVFQVRSSVAVVPQDTVLFDDTIAYNIAFGRQGCTRQEVEHAARLAQLHDFIADLPQGYDTRVGERGVKLSGGERQRISIARAVLKRAPIYVFDEATSSLDSRTERQILANLREVSRSCTTLMIAHRLSTVVHADQIVVLENGRVVEYGTHDNLIRAEGRFAQLWNAQQAAGTARAG